MDEFIHALKKRGFSLDDHQLTQFDIYRQELKDWNTKINLTSLTDDLDIIDKHFIDSLLLVRYEQLRHGVRIADVGTGAGFPGLPIKIYRPDIYLLLLESVGKKTSFLKHIVTKLDLENVDVVNDRAEVAARSPEHREQYDLVIARCVASLPVLAEYCLPLVSVGGKFVAYKGHKAEAEVRDAEVAVKELGGRFERIESRKDTVSSEILSSPFGKGEQGGRLSSPEGNTDRRVLVFIEKVKKTPGKYPRRPGIPRKRPL
jgi:16S rRNA (guanine527-N7)-methyltransferase